MSTRNPARERFVTEAFRAGARDALGVPAAVVAAGMVGFGAFALEHGMSLPLALACTAGIWALPGQMVLLETHASGAPGYLTVLAVLITNARFLPITLSLMPLIREPRYGRLTLYALAQLNSMTGWTWAMRACVDMPQRERIPYFAGFAGACWSVCIVATGASYLVAGGFPPELRVGLVFLAPLYYLVILIGDARTSLAIIALACGALAGPLCYLVSAQWSVLLAGVVGGTAAYGIDRLYRRRSHA
ncbi:MAG TPA: AzlC family ABC transporter permease [Burkholderiales bacterium]|jgi:predicted branched-subunit amino acid permease|nr:AzlC family ABC transporter permease [Burkholderiales bacterium]